MLQIDAHHHLWRYNATEYEGDLASQRRDFPAILAHYREQTSLKALRHVVQAEVPGFLDSGAFNTDVAALQGIGLVYDPLIFPHQLQEVLCTGTTYERWWQLLRSWTSTLTTSEQAALLGGTAIVAYGLDADALESTQEISA